MFLRFFCEWIFEYVLDIKGKWTNFFSIFCIVSKCCITKWYLIQRHRLSKCHHFVWHHFPVAILLQKAVQEIISQFHFGLDNPHTTECLCHAFAIHYINQLRNQKSLNYVQTFQIRASTDCCAEFTNLCVCRFSDTQNTKFQALCVCQIKRRDFDPKEKNIH